MPNVEFKDKDLLNAIQQETGFDMTDMVIIKKELIDDKLKVFYRPRRQNTILVSHNRDRGYTI